MKITFRLVVSLLVVAALSAACFSLFEVAKERRYLVNELEGRAGTVAESVKLSVRYFLRSGETERLNYLVTVLGNRKRLAGIEVSDSQGKILASTPGLLEKIQKPLSELTLAIAHNQKAAGFDTLNHQPVYVYALPVLTNNQKAGFLVLLFNTSYIHAKLKDIWKDNFFYFLFESLLIIFTTVLVVRWSITGPIARLAEWFSELRTGKRGTFVQPPRGDVLHPLAVEAGRLAQSLVTARAAAEREARMRAESESHWTAEKLQEYMRVELKDKRLIVASNREPYMHIKKGKDVECIIPSGGLVTAVDPVLRVCGGLWIAHGSGDADWITADKNGTLQVPPENPKYALKRLWLTKEEEEGYYYGFSNEGLWPLCHITHIRPLFRLEDWIQYQKVNEKFAAAVLEEIRNEEEPLILIQDYHLALLPLLVKLKRPDARVAIFWHIPWPNPEAFGICPWKEEILLGLLGGDLIGFHVQFHCNNFLETVDQFLESKVDWEHFSVERQGTLTWIKPFPISVAFPPQIQELPKSGKEELKKAILKELGISAEFLGIGVDRIDYTKGIVERLKAIERFLEKYPRFIGKFTFVELGSPSRTKIKRYHDLVAEVEETVERINWKYQTKEWKPMVLLKSHHVHESIYRYYSAADLCMVTSLHDGMNLVAKEFVASQDEENGVLILSRFTGASRELLDALMVNPYDIEQMADAVLKALTMEPEERKKRMKRMREVVKERNVYRWAANLITTLSRLRIPELTKT